MSIFLACASPSVELSLTNKIHFNPQEYSDRLNYVAVITQSDSYVFCAEADSGVAKGKVALGKVHRQWANVSLGEKVTVKPVSIDMRQGCLGSAVLALDFYGKNNGRNTCLDSDAMARDFTLQFVQTPLTVGQLLIFRFNGVQFIIEAKKLTTISLDTSTGAECKTGMLVANTVVFWERKPESRVVLTGKAVIGDSANSAMSQSILNLNWDFSQLGIGGLDKEFSQIFRRTFASRMFPPAVSEQLGLKHIRGMLLFGPPGTGKTLMARQIGKMISSRPPKIVNGPSILDKYVGESEANIRKLFAEAEEEEKRMGPNSALHIIIFDEIDAICKTRGSTAGGAGVHDTVVNQLLTKMDGVEQLNNVLVIGMTNRKDMIDEALLRPGRFEIQMEISLPDKDGRLQILQIHTSKMREARKLAEDVNLPHLAKRTENFSGAELEGLCRAAAFTAMYKQIGSKDEGKLDPAAFDRMIVTQKDFIYALENDIKPAFGTSEEELTCYAPRGIMVWGETVSEAFRMADMSLRTLRSSYCETYRALTLLIEGPPKAGKTAMAVEIAKKSNFPFVKIIASHKMIGYTEVAKCQVMKKIFDDGAKSPYSVIIIDSIEDLIEYNPVGPRFSNFIVQAIRDVLIRPLKAGRRMLVLGTTSRLQELYEQNLTQAFSWHIHISPMTLPQHILSALEEDERFSSSERQQIERSITGQSYMIGIKHLIEIMDLSSAVDADNRVLTFLTKLEEEDPLMPSSRSARNL